MNRTFTVSYLGPIEGGWFGIAVIAVGAIVLGYELSRPAEPKPPNDGF